MLKRYMTSRFAQIVTMALIVSTASGCATASKASNWLTGKSPPENEDYVVLGAPSADEYLTELNDLVAGNPDKQADILADASSAAELTPGPSTKLRLGLVLATPGHAGSDPARAQSVLREVLAQTELMTTAEIAFATIALNNVESEIGVSTSAASAAPVEVDPYVLAHGPRAVLVGDVLVGFPLGDAIERALSLDGDGLVAHAPLLVARGPARGEVDAAGAHHVRLASQDEHLHRALPPLAGGVGQASGHAGDGGQFAGV